MGCVDFRASGFSPTRVVQWDHDYISQPAEVQSTMVFHQTDLAETCVFTIIAHCSRMTAAYDLTYMSMYS